MEIWPEWVANKGLRASRAQALTTELSGRTLRVPKGLQDQGITKSKSSLRDYRVRRSIYTAAHR